MPVTLEYDEAKFKELLLYVADRMSDDMYFGATKLNKVLFYSDFLYYFDHGVAITGAEYQKLDHGPAPRRLLPVQAELIAEGDAVIRMVKVAGFTQKRLIPLRDADVSLFSGPEIATVESVMSQVDGRFAKDVSNASHRLLGWRAASIGQTIPYPAAFLASGPVTEADILFAKEAEHGDFFMSNHLSGRHRARYRICWVCHVTHHPSF